jgi:quinol monooxygenase YgiN
MSGTIEPMHSIVAITGVILAAVGSGVLLSRFFRTPRGDLAAWVIGLLGLLVSLAAQVIGYVKGFDGTTFRAMELGGQVVAPMAFLAALAEVSARSALGRFCSRLYIGALGIVALVILALDQLTDARFSKSFPPAATFYQTPPNYVLMYAIGPLTALVAVISMLMVLSRSGRPGWKDAVTGQLMGGVAALALAYPGLAEFASHHIKAHIPLGSVFAIICTIAVVLGWLAGERSASLPLAAMHGQTAGDDGRTSDDPRRDQANGYRGGDGYDRAGRYDRADGPGRGDRYASVPQRGEGDGYSDLRYADSFGEGVFRGGGLYRPEQPGLDPRGDRPDNREVDGYADFATGDFMPGDFAGDDEVWDSSDGMNPRGGEWQAHPDESAWEPDDEQGRDRWHDAGPVPRGQRDVRRHHDDEEPSDRRRADLFGQITIYTLVDDRVDAFDRITERVVEQVRRREPDTLVFIVHAVPSAPTERILYQVYRSRAAYQRHLAQPHVQQFDLDRRPYVLATNVVELGLQQAKVSPFPSVAELYPEPGYDTSGFERPDYLRDYGRRPARRGDGPRDYR